MRSAVAMQFARGLIFLWLFAIGYAAVFSGVGLIIVKGSGSDNPAPPQRSAVIPAPATQASGRSPAPARPVIFDSAFRTISYRTAEDLSLWQPNEPR